MKKEAGSRKMDYLSLDEDAAFGMRGHIFERGISPLQDLTFEETEREFLLHGIPFGEEEKKSLGLMDRRGLYTNLALLLSDQCPFTISERSFGKDFESIHERREFKGPLLSQMKEAYGFLDFRNQTRAEFRGLYRVERRDYPEKAIREGIMNLLLHRDYSFPTFTKVSLYLDRIEILSPGGLGERFALEDALLGRSCHRNPRLVEIFRLLHLIPASGEGIRRILRSYEGDIRKPVFRTTKNTFLLVLPNRNYPVDGKVTPIPA